MRRFFFRLLNAVCPRSAEPELSRELASHLALLEDEYRRRGLTPDHARRAARIALGGVEQTKERHRDARSFVWIDDARRDLRYGARMLRRNPIFALTAALSLAIGVGANTTIFTVANALLFAAPAGVSAPDRLVDIVGVVKDRGGLFFQLSYPEYLDIRRRATTLEAVYGYGLGPQPMSLGGANGAERIFGNLVTSNFFSVLGVRPAAGRLFGAGDSDQPGASPIVVLSYSFWIRRFAADPAIVGTALQLNGQPVTVVGVAPERFQGTNITVADVWMPVSMIDLMTHSGAPTGIALTMRPHGFLVVGGRLKPGVTVAQASAEIDSISRAIENEHPELEGGRRLHLSKSSPIPDVARLPVAAFLALLSAIVGIVLLIACANVASVLLARATARRREIAVRLAIGAGRARLVRQLLTETVMLFALGGGAGLLFARVMTVVISRLIRAVPLPIGVPVALDNRAIVFTTGLALAAAALSGLAPALHASRADVVSTLKNEAPGQSERLRLPSVFVVAQVALSILLVVVAGLLVRALERAGSIDLGFDPRGIELTELDLSLAGYSDASGREFVRDLLDRARAIPDVSAASAAALLPMGGGVRGTMGLFGLTVPGQAMPRGKSAPPAFWNVVQPGYFTTLGIPLLAGRDFSAADRGSAPKVAIIGEATARRFWPGKPVQDAIGQVIVAQFFLLRPIRGSDTGNQQPGTPLVVVGVVRDVKYTNLRQQNAPLFVYAPFEQQYLPAITLAVRSRNGQRTADAIRRLVASMNPNLPIVGSRTLEEALALSLVPQRVGAAVSASLGIVGLLLAAIGIYGVTAYAVTRRTREIGIHVAVGAERRHIVAMILRQGLSLTLAGSIVGLVLAAAGSRLLKTLLFGVAPLDPVTFVSASILFIVVGIVACCVPVRRALRIDPMEALRYE